MQRRRGWGTFTTGSWVWWTSKEWNICKYCWGISMPRETQVWTCDGKAWTGNNEHNWGVSSDFWALNTWSSVAVSYHTRTPTRLPGTVPWHCHRKPDRSCVHWEKKFRQSLQDVRVKRCILRPPPGDGYAQAQSDAMISTDKPQSMLKSGSSEGQGDSWQVSPQTGSRPLKNCMRTAIEAKLMWIRACEEIVGRNTTQHREWITSAILQKFKIRKGKPTALSDSRTR